MRSFLSFSWLLLFPLIAAGARELATIERLSSRQSLPSAAEVLDHYIDVTGGKAAYEKLQNQVISGSVEFVEAGFKGKTAEYRSAPNKVYRVVDLAGVGKVEAGSDGRIAWELTSETGPRIKAGEEGAAALREANFNASLRWRELYDKVEFLGEESIEGQSCYRIVLTPKAGKPVTQYYDKKSGLLAKIVMTTLTPTMGEVPSETVLSDYKIEGGILVPHDLKRKVLSQQILTHIESVQFNTEIPKDRFDLPEQVKALLVNKLIPD
jgi:hypothetical protein